MFNEHSIIAYTWAKLVKAGKYALEQVPNLYNLREVVAGMVAE